MCQADEAGFDHNDESESPSPRAGQPSPGELLSPVRALGNRGRNSMGMTLLAGGSGDMDIFGDRSFGYAAPAPSAPLKWMS